MAEKYSELIAYYVDLLRKGDEDAWHRFEEFDAQALPILQQYAVSEQDEEVRAYLVEVIWQYRRPESIPFLAQILSDPSKKVWKGALDGLVVLGTDAALAALKTARASASAKQLEYIDEAIDQIEHPEAWMGIERECNANRRLFGGFLLRGRRPYAAKSTLRRADIADLLSSFR